MSPRFSCASLGELITRIRSLPSRLHIQNQLPTLKDTKGCLNLFGEVGSIGATGSRKRLSGRRSCNPRKIGPQFLRRDPLSRISCHSCASWAPISWLSRSREGLRQAGPIQAASLMWIDSCLPRVAKACPIIRGFISKINYPRNTLKDTKGCLKFLGEVGSIGATGFRKKIVWVSDLAILERVGPQFLGRDPLSRISCDSCFSWARSDGDRIVVSVVKLIDRLIPVW